MTPAIKTARRAAHKAPEAADGTAPQPAAPPTPGPATPAPVTPTPAVRQRRRPTLIVLGATLAAVGGLGGAYLAQRGGTPQSVLVAANRLEPGHKISLNDLTAVQIGTVGGTSTLPESSKSSLVGRTVTSRVDAGTILNPATVVDRIIPGVGSSVVGVAVKQGQYPAYGLQAGDPVHLVVSANGQTGGTASTIKPGTSWAGTVLSVSDPNRDGIRSVDVTLPADQALQAATASGTGALTVVLDASARK